MGRRRCRCKRRARRHAAALAVAVVGGGRCKQPVGAASWRRAWGCWRPCLADSLQLPVVHAPFRLLQSTGAPALRLPWPSHAGAEVRLDLSGDLGFFSHVKLPAPLEVQVPTAQSLVAALQSGALPALHAPARHASPWVQPLSSALQVVPSALGVTAHWPVAGLRAGRGGPAGRGQQSMGALPLTQLPIWHWPEPGFWHLSPVWRAGRWRAAWWCKTLLCKRLACRRCCRCSRRRLLHRRCRWRCRPRLAALAGVGGARVAVVAGAGVVEQGTRQPFCGRTGQKCTGCCRRTAPRWASGRNTLGRAAIDGARHAVVAVDLGAEARAARAGVAGGARVAVVARAGAGRALAAEHGVAAIGSARVVVVAVGGLGAHAGAALPHELVWVQALPSVAGRAVVGGFGGAEARGGHARYGGAGGGALAHHRKGGIRFAVAGLAGLRAQAQVVAGGVAVGVALAAAA